MPDDLTVLREDLAQVHAELFATRQRNQKLIEMADAAQTQRDRESQANRDLARANRALIAERDALRLSRLDRRDPRVNVLRLLADEIISVGKACEALNEIAGGLAPILPQPIDPDAYDDTVSWKDRAETAERDVRALALVYATLLGELGKVEAVIDPYRVSKAMATAGLAEWSVDGSWVTDQGRRLERLGAAEWVAREGR